MERDRLVLVTEHDKPIGSVEKMRAHVEGLLHRAFSVFLFNDGGEMLLQRRAIQKYHSPGLWSNSCCGHPRPGEETLAAARRRMSEELSVECPIRHIGQFHYRVRMPNGLVEHEVDHVFIGRYNGTIEPNPDEVAQCRWAEIGQLAIDMESRPTSFTPWFGIAIERFGLLSENRLNSHLFTLRHEAAIRIGNGR